MSVAEVPETGAPARERVARNAAALAFLRVGLPLLSLLLVFTLSRTLGAEGLGRYTLAFTFIYFFSAVAPLGLEPLVTRDGARDPHLLEPLLATGLTLGTLWSIVLTAGMATLGGLLDYDAETRRAIMLVSLSLVPTTCVALFEGACVARERMAYLAAAGLAETSFKVVAATLLLWSGHGLAAVLVMGLLGRTANALVLGALLRRSGLRVGWRFDGEVARRVLRLAPTFLLTQLAFTAYWRIDMFMLSRLAPIEAVGQYGAAYRLLELAMILPQSLCQAVYPQVAAAVRHDPGAVRRLLTGTLRTTTVIGLPIALGISLVAGGVLQLLYGPQLAGAGPALAVLLWTALPYSWVRLHAQVMVAADRQAADLAINVTMAIVNVTLNAIAIPRFGYLGAAATTVTCVCLFALLQLLFLRRALPQFIAAPPIDAPVLGAAAVLAAVVWTLRSAGVLVALPAGAIAYFGTLFATGFLAREGVSISDLPSFLARARGQARL